MNLSEQSRAEMIERQKQWLDGLISFAEYIAICAMVQQQIEADVAERRLALARADLAIRSTYL